MYFHCSFHVDIFNVANNYAVVIIQVFREKHLCLQIILSSVIHTYIYDFQILNYMISKLCTSKEMFK
jgi:hypothetical protein